MAPLDVNTIANVATACTLLVAVAFGLVQYRQATRRRADAAALAAIEAVESPEMTRHFLHILSLRDGMAPEEVRADPSIAEAARAVVIKAETFGCMIFERVVPLHTVDRLYGGFLRAVWRKLEPWIQDERKEMGVANFAEWFEWLVDQLEAHPEPSKAVGAQVKYRDWKP